MDGSDVNGPILDHIYSPWSFTFSFFTLKHKGSLRSTLIYTCTKYYEAFKDLKKN